MPAHLTGGGVHRHDGGAVLVIQRRTLTCPEIWRGVAGWQIDQVQFCIVRHGRPDVWRAACIGLSFRWEAGQLRITRIPCPCQLAGMNVIRTHDARRFTGGEVIRDTTADHHHIPRDQRRGGLLIVARLDFPHPDAQVNGATIAKVFTDFAVIRIDSNQSRIGGRQEQTTRAGRRLCICL